jgi:hypothetical protein
MSAETIVVGQHPAAPPPPAPAVVAQPAGPAATPAPAPAPQPQTVTIPLEQLQTFTSVQARLAQLEAEQRSRDEAARAEQVKLMAAKGEIENALRLQREEAQKQLDAERTAKVALEERAKRYALDGELSRVLASQPLVPGGAEQLTQLWRNQFTVEPQGDSFNVRTPTFQSVGDFVKAKLGAPEYSHFIRASNPGGGTAGGAASGALAQPTPAANPAAPVEFKNFGEALIAQVKANQQERETLPIGSPRESFGLRRKA